MTMDNDELKDLKELKAIKEAYGWTDETRGYKVRLKAILKKYSELAKAGSKSKGGKVKAPTSRTPSSSSRWTRSPAIRPLWSWIRIMCNTYARRRGRA